MTYLPKTRLQKRISDLKPGEECWSTPWAIKVATDLSMWLDLSAYQLSRGGTIRLNIKRDNEGHFQATIYGEYKWTMSQSIDQMSSIAISKFVEEGL